MRRSGENRAVQFAAYRALKGYEEMVAEYTREREPRIRLSEESMDILSAKLSALRKGDSVEAKYYETDRYVSLKGTVTDCDGILQVLVIGKKKIPFRDLLNVRKTGPEGK